MSTSSDLRTLVMHGLRLKGFAEAAAVAEAVGVEPSDAEPMLDDLVAEGLATYRDGRISGYTLTPAGRADHALRLAVELESAGAHQEVGDAYGRFLDLNGRLLSICTAWQLRDGESVVNDHTDPAYDAAVIADLRALHDAALPICAALSDALERFAIYGPSLTHAIERVEAGDTDWFTKPMLASYHTVWFELHEDLLSTLGLERGSEEVNA
jgi:hypothetical protein